MNNYYESNPAMKEQVFTTPQGHLVAWSTLLTVKETMMKHTGEELTLPQALKLVDDWMNK